MVAKVVPAPAKGKSDKKEPVKKAALAFTDDAIDDKFVEEVIEPIAVVADPFHSDDFDTSRKELEEGYLDDEEEEEDSEDDLYADDETESFESYEEEDLDYDDEDDYGPSAFAGPKKKKFEDDYEDDEEE